MPFFDTFFQDLGVGYEQVVTNQLDFVAQNFGPGMRNRPSQIRPDRLRWKRSGTVWSVLSRK
ncbi:Uncharacterised protein [Escherichia coli]|nr:Uncharacterised protein [Escherichia coli]